MVFPVVGGNQSTGDFITNSLRLNDDDSPKLARTPSTEGNRKTFSISFWQKKANMNHGNDYLIQVSGNSDTTNFEVSNHSTHAFQVGLHSVNLIRTTRLFRDPSAWTHFFFFIDTTQASESNRFQLYVNGIQETDFSQTNIPSQNADIGLGRDVATTFFNSIDAYISDFHYVDGIKKAHTDFGEFDTNGVWVPKEYDGSYGSQGIRLEFKQTGTSANASGIGADTSGNGNHLTPTNLAAIDVTTDTPMNNFCTLNPLDNYYASSTFSEGNVKMVSASTGSGTSTNAFKTSTFGLTRGKWYWEAKLSNATGYDQIGISQLVASSTSDHLGNSSSAYSIRGDTGNFMNNNSASSYGVSFTTNDIISVALDLDNNLIYFYKNGTVMNSGTGKSISAGTYFPSFGKQDPAAVTWEVNFGNPSFSISSGNSDGKYGNFEYAPPSGYYACCTKNLAQFG